MVLIVGGAYQGKLDFARETFGAEKTAWICPRAAVEVDAAHPSGSLQPNGAAFPGGSSEPDWSADILGGFHWLVLSLLRAGQDPCAWIERNGDALSGKIILCDDISCGVVPMEPQARAWREALGRCLGMLSRRADGVYRVFCGIGSKLK